MGGGRWSVNGIIKGNEIGWVLFGSPLEYSRSSDETPKNFDFSCEATWTCCG
jgi:hypothetical protein